MAEETHSIGVGLSVIIDDVPISFKTTYDSITLAMEVESCKLDMVKTANERFNDMNVVVPEDSSNLMIASFAGSIAKTDKQKKQDISGNYRLIQFEGKMENITIPIPIISDIQIDEAFFYYQYLSAQSNGTDKGFKDQVVFMGCRLSVKKDTDLYSALTDASLSGAYFLSNNATIIYFDFSGVINVGNIIKAIFGVPSLNLTIDVKSAGIFRIAKTNKTKSIPVTNGKPETTVPEMTYLDALKQIANLQKSSVGPKEGSDVNRLMPKSFPLVEKPVTEAGITTSKLGIKVGEKEDLDFSVQFEKAFAGENVTGICFWVMIDFNQLSFFNSLITIGYKDQQINSLVLYGFKTQAKDKKINPSSYFYAQLPVIKLFNFLTFGGLDGRQGILFKYMSDKNQYELNGSISFDVFSKSFIFGGDLIVNDDRLLASLDVTMDSPQQIEKPLGMSGINFGKLFFCIDKTFEKKATETKPEVKGNLDLTIGGCIDFNFAGSEINLDGNIVFENNEARLVLISLDTTPALTLNNFIKEIIAKPWDWVDDITRQIGFIAGSMYFLEKPKSEKDTKDYTFTYTNPIISKPKTPATNPIDPSIKITKYKPGYHVHADLLFFEHYVFVIDLDVETEGVSITGSYGGTYANSIITRTTTITAYFISFESPSLTICTIKKTMFFLKINHIKLFNTDLGSIEFRYSGGIFYGTYDHVKPTFGFDWQWTKKHGNSGGFSITKINRIGNRELDAITSLIKKLNSASSKGGCEAIVKSLFGELKSSFKPALQTGKSPVEKGNDKMEVPLAIEYTFSVGKTVIIQDTLNITLDVTIPKTFADLPEAIFRTVIENMEGIIVQLLENPVFYKTLALEMAKTGGASLAARMLCRQGKKTLGIELADALSLALEAGLIFADAGALYELGQVLCAIGIAVAAAALLAFLLKAWDEINKCFKDDEEKKKAQEKLDSSKILILKQIEATYDSLDELRESIRIKKFDVGIETNGNYNATWISPQNPIIGEHTNLDYELIFLDGAIGNHTAVKSRIPSIGFETLNTSEYSAPWTILRQLDPAFQMNASIQTSFTGYTFMTLDAKTNLQKTIEILNEIGDILDGAVDFNNQLKKFVSEMQEYNENGLKSTIVYATSNNQFVIGKSALGINTKIN